MNPWDFQHGFWIVMVTTVQTDNAKNYYGFHNQISVTVLDKYLLPGCNFISKA